jgi:hypothetical protein
MEQSHPETRKLLHDLSNALLAIRGYGELSLLELSEGAAGPREGLEKICEAADRAIHLARSLALELNPDE